MSTYRRRATEGYPRIPAGLTPGITAFPKPTHRAPIPAPRIGTGMTRNFDRFGPGADQLVLNRLGGGFGLIRRAEDRLASRQDYGLHEQEVATQQEELGQARATADHTFGWSNNTHSAEERYERVRIIPRRNGTPLGGPIHHPGPGGHPPRELGMAGPPTTAQQRASSGWKLRDLSDSVDPKLSRTTTLARTKANRPAKGPSKATKAKAIPANSKEVRREASATHREKLWAENPSNPPPTPQM